MSVRFSCDQCDEATDAEAAIGWVEVRPLGPHPLHAPEPHHLCRLCWARMSAPELAVVGGGRSQASEHTQSRDTLQ